MSRNAASFAIYTLSSHASVLITYPSKAKGQLLAIGCDAAVAGRVRGGGCHRRAAAVGRTVHVHDGINTGLVCVSRERRTNYWQNASRELLRSAAVTPKYAAAVRNLNGSFHLCAADETHACVSVWCASPQKGVFFACVWVLGIVCNTAGDVARLIIRIRETCQTRVVCVSNNCVADCWVTLSGFTVSCTWMCGSCFDCKFQSHQTYGGAAFVVESYFKCFSAGVDDNCQYQAPFEWFSKWARILYQAHNYHQIITLAIGHTFDDDDACSSILIYHRVTCNSRNVALIVSTSKCLWQSAHILLLYPIWWMGCCKFQLQIRYIQIRADCKFLAQHYCYMTLWAAVWWLCDDRHHHTREMIAFLWCVECTIFAQQVWCE